MSAQKALWLLQRGADARFNDRPLGPDFVRAAREIRGLSREDLGQSLGVEGFEIRAWEMGIALPLPEMLSALAEVTDHRLTFFFQEEREIRMTILCPAFYEGVERCVKCDDISEYLCDYILPSEQTCDRPTCEAHTWCQDLEAERDYCPEHGQRINHRIGI